MVFGRRSWSAVRWWPLLAAVFIFGGSLAYFIRFTLLVYYSYRLGLPNNLWGVLHSIGGT